MYTNHFSYKLFLKTVFSLLILLIMFLGTFNVTQAKTQEPGWYHKTPNNGVCMEHYYKNGGPNIHSGWKKGRCPNDSPNNNGENNPETPVNRINNLGLSVVVKVLTANYNNGILNITWLGIPNSSRICKDSLGHNCIPLEPPTKLGVNTNGYFGYISVKLEKGFYFVDLQGSKNGGAVKFEAK